MTEEQWIWTVDERIASRHGAGQAFQAEVLDRLKATGWNENDIFAIRLALEEALVNAIKHGNSHDDSKQVHIACKLSPHRIWFEITDEGPGFDPADVPDPTHDENLEYPSGRGIMLMRSFMCRVEYNASGNCVVMEKHRSRAG